MDDALAQTRQLYGDLSLVTLNGLAATAEIEHWAERDPILVGIYISLQAPEGKLLDNPDLHPLYDAAQAFDLAFQLL